MEWRQTGVPISISIKFMQKRTLFILIGILGSVAILFFGFLFFFPQSKPAQIIQNVQSPNFFPFASTPKPTAPTQPVDISGTGVEAPATNTGTTNELALTKISSFPISGFGTYSKEVFASTPITDTTTSTPTTEQPSTT